jgi:hypothetical protein
MASVEDHFAIAAQLLHADKRDEADRIQVEKRFIRYELVTRPAAEHDRARISNMTEFRNYKRWRFELARKPLDGHGKHTCRTGTCEFANVRSGTVVRDPRTGQTVRASGLVYICKDTLVMHLCGKDNCKRAIAHRQGIMVCGISGLEVGQQYGNSYGVMHNSELDHGEEVGSGGGGGEGAGGTTCSEEPSGTDLLLFPEGSGASAATMPRKPKRMRTAAPPAPPPLAAVAKTPQPINLYLGRVPIKVEQPSYIFFKNSHAEAMALATGRKDICYGNQLLDWVFRNADPRDKRAAEEFCEAMLFHPAATALREKLQLEALQLAEQRCTQYMQDCRRSRMQPDWVAVWNFFHQHSVGPFLTPVVAQCLSKQRGADIHARQYFSEAVWRIWKIVESSPFCCAEHLRWGDATPKKKRSHIHLKRIGVAIFYALRHGIRQDIWYNIRTQQVYMEQADAQKEADQREVACEQVDFVPAHVYLARRLPPEDRFSSLQFGSVSGTGQVVTAVVDTFRWLTKCYQSLTVPEPALTIQRVREYRLVDLMVWQDEDEQGGFGPVTN